MRLTRSAVVYGCTILGGVEYLEYADATHVVRLVEFDF